MPSDFSKPPPALPNAKKSVLGGIACEPDTSKTMIHEPEVLQPPPAFDPRKPIISSVPEKKHEEVRQPPAVFDPRLSLTERSSLMLGAATREPPKTSMPPPPVMIPGYAAFMPPVQMTYPAVPMPVPVSCTAPLPVPPLLNPEPMPPPPIDPSPAASFDEDGLEEMQEAMEFAKQLMSMSEENSARPPTPVEQLETQAAKLVEVATSATAAAPAIDPVTVSALPKRVSPTPSPGLAATSVAASIAATVASSSPVVSLGIEPATLEQAAQIMPGMDILKISQQILMDKHTTEDLLRHTQLLNLNNEAIAKVSASGPKSLPLVAAATVPLVVAATVPLLGVAQTHSGLQSPSEAATADVRKAVKLPSTEKKPAAKKEVSALEASWKHRVINRFLKMSKNEIRNMLNHSSLRKFDIAMNRLVREKRYSINQEIRMSEDERMREYDREEFMNQLNAMLDPKAAVDISNLPTDFIHHLNEVLQLDPLQFEAGPATTTIGGVTAITGQPLVVPESTKLPDLGIATTLQSEVQII
jgi:hypothetical protein